MAIDRKAASGQVQFFLLQKLEQDAEDSYMGSAWADSSSLKHQFHGMSGIQFQPGKKLWHIWQVDCSGSLCSVTSTLPVQGQTLWTLWASLFLFPSYVEGQSFENKWGGCQRVPAEPQL